MISVHLIGVQFLRPDRDQGTEIDLVLHGRSRQKGTKYGAYVH